MVQGYEMATVNAAGLWVRFPLEEMIYLILIFSSCNEAKCAVEFCYSTSNAS